MVAKATLDTATRNFDAAKQTVAEAAAAEDRTRQAFGATVDGEHSVIVRLRNELADAQYDLDQTIVRAPTGGFVTELALRPGVYVVPAPFRPAMIFVNDSQRDRALVAAFQQNTLQRVRAGDEAEVLFKGIPGRVFKAKVRLVIDAIAGGQLQTTGTLVNVEGRCPETGLWPSLTSSMTCPVTRCRLVRQAKPPSTRSIFTSFRCCGKFFCACEAGRTTYSSKDMAGGVSEDRAATINDKRHPLAPVLANEGWERGRVALASG